MAFVQSPRPILVMSAECICVLLIYILVNVLISGELLEQPEPKLVLKDVVQVHDTIKNTKARQAMDELSQTEHPIGSGTPGETRWGSRYYQFKVALKNRNNLESILRSVRGQYLYQFQSYIPQETKNVVVDDGKWQRITRIKDILHDINIALKLCEGNVCTFMYIENFEIFENSRIFGDVYISKTLEVEIW